MIDQGIKKYMPACEAESIFQEEKSKKISSFNKGLSRETFLDLFSSCRIGALLRNPEDMSRKNGYTEKTLDEDHVILEVRQMGTWGAS